MNEIKLMEALFHQKNYSEVEIIANKLIKKNPKSGFAWKFLSASQLLAGKDPSVSILNAVKYLKKDYECHNNAGVYYKNIKEYKLAEKHLLISLEIKSDNTSALVNLGVIFKDTGKFKKAEEVYLKALMINPTDIRILCNLGVVYQELKQFKEAIDCYTKALEINNTIPEAYSNLSNVYQLVGRHDLAIKFALEALKLKANFSMAHNNLGVALKDAGNLHGALVSYRNSLRGDSILPEVYINIGEVLQEMGRVEESVNVLKELINKDAEVLAFHNLLFSLNYHPSLSAEDIYSYYSEYDQKHCNFEKFFKYNCDILKNRKIKIGYVSPDFKKHSMRHFLLPLIQGHDKSKFELHAYAELINEDEFTLDYKRSFDHWTVTTDMSDDALAIKIHDDSIDILIDCAGHTKGNRLFVFARKPAPISISMLGYGYTTGLKSIDYFLCNKVLVPDDAEKYFSESPLRIDGPWAVYRPDPDMPEVSELPALKNGYITFCTLTRAVRINELVIEVWSEILKRCENSKLRIDSSSFTSNKMKEEFYSKFEKMGIDKNRLTIGFNTPAASVLSEVDITLDCFPHNSGTTLYESLYMGVPFITLASRPSVGLIGSSILDAMNRQEWICTNTSEYINRSVFMAKNITELSRIRKDLRDDVKKNLMNEKKYVNDFEKSLIDLIAQNL